MPRLKEVNSVTLLAEDGQSSLILVSSVKFITFNFLGISSLIRQKCAADVGLFREEELKADLGYERTSSKKERVLKVPQDLGRWRGPRRFFKGRETRRLTVSWSKLSNTDAFAELYFLCVGSPHLLLHKLCQYSST